MQIIAAYRYRYCVQVEGYTSSKDGCQSIVTDIAKDILNQREHRVNRYTNT